MTKALEQSLKDRLKPIARAQGRTFNEIWKTVILERFLVRLARSKYRDRFIFKGGLLLARYLEIGRETADGDFLARSLKVDASTVENILSAVANVRMKDGFAFRFQRLQVLLQPHMPYPGYRLFFEALLGQTRTTFSVDVGVGDVVSPVRRAIPLLAGEKGPVFEKRITLYVYPPETIFAEKLESVVSRGALNSRMKDFHDLLLMARRRRFLRKAPLRKAVQHTFQARKTDLALPVGFDSEAIVGLQRLWTAHLRQLGSIAERLRLPLEIASLLSELNAFFTASGISRK